MTKSESIPGMESKLGRDPVATTITSGAMLIASDISVGRPQRPLHRFCRDSVLDSALPRMSHLYKAQD